MRDHRVRGWIVVATVLVIVAIVEIVRRMTL